ncbi:aspartate racemase/maleate isomerase family protein [Streptomyces antibioticus]|uniref:aspartate racemase/maleate isomerase family protein n=1 Tax=Streptomyces antibioticus TaxID=1890 RepID=UPI0033B288D2
MTALGFLSPGPSAADDYPRIEQLLGSDIRLDLVRTDRPAEGVEQLRLAGVEAVVWVCADEGVAPDPDTARNRLRDLATTAGVPASSTPFAFVRAAREIDAMPVAVSASGTPEETARFAEFLRAGGLEVVGDTGAVTDRDAEAGGDEEAALLALARAADDPRARAVLLPDPDLSTAAHLPALEAALGKPVLTASQVAVWEALRLTDRRVHAPELGALFTREPIVQV